MFAPISVLCFQGSTEQSCFRMLPSDRVLRSKINLYSPVVLSSSPFPPWSSFPLLTPPNVFPLCQLPFYAANNRRTNPNSFFKGIHWLRQIKIQTLFELIWLEDLSSASSNVIKQGYHFTVLPCSTFYRMSSSLAFTLRPLRQHHALPSWKQHGCISSSPHITLSVGREHLFRQPPHQSWDYFSLGLT